MRGAGILRGNQHGNWVGEPEILEFVAIQNLISGSKICSLINLLAWCGKVPIVPIPSPDLAVNVFQVSGDGYLRCQHCPS